MDRIYRMFSVVFILLFATNIVNCQRVNADYTSQVEAEKKAEEMHQRASSDVIFVDEELKALYYQNVQIIDILKEIKELLRQKLEEEEE